MKRLLSSLRGSKTIWRVTEHPPPSSLVVARKVGSEGSWSAHFRRPLVFLEKSKSILKGEPEAMEVFRVTEDPKTRGHLRIRGRGGF